MDITLQRQRGQWNVASGRANDATGSWESRAGAVFSPGTREFKTETKAEILTTWLELVCCWPREMEIGLDMHEFSAHPAEHL